MSITHIIGLHPHQSPLWIKVDREASFQQMMFDKEWIEFHGAGCALTVQPYLPPAFDGCVGSEKFFVS